MNVFKKVARGSSNLFKKGENLSQNIFKKSSQIANTIKNKGPEALEKINQTAGKTANILDKVSKISGKIASNPITGSVPIIGSGLQSAAGLISQGSRYGAQGARNVEDLSNLNKYRKGGVNKQLENVRDISNRGKELLKNAENLGGLVIG